MSGIKYKSSNDDLDEKSNAKRSGLTSAQGKVLASLHNVLPEIFGFIGDDPSVPIPNLKTRYKWWSRGGTTGISAILRDNLKKANKAMQAGISSYIVNHVALMVALECLNLEGTLVEGSLKFLERFYQQMKGDASDTSRRGKIAWDLTMEVYLQMWRDISVVRSPSSGVEDGD